MTTTQDTAQAVLVRLHGITGPTPDQLAAAVSQVEADQPGTRLLLGGNPIPPARSDLRMARSDGRYLPR